MFSKGLWKQHFVPALTLIPPHQLILSPDVDTLKKMCGGGGDLPHSAASRGKQRKACVHLIHTTGGLRQGETGGGGVTVQSHNKTQGGPIAMM